MGLTKAVVALAVAILAVACTLPPLSQIIYRAYSEAWPPARASKVFSILNGGMNFAAVKSGMQFGVFEKLHNKPQTAAELAKEIPADTHGISTLLEYLSTLDLISPDPAGAYHLGAAAQTHLVRSSPDYVGAFVSIFGSESWESKLQTSADAIIRGGASPAESHDGMATKGGKNHHGFWTTFAKETMEFSVQPANAMADLTIASLPTDLPADGQLQVLDVACGTGTYGFLLAQRHPGIEVTSMDQKNVLPHTKKWAEHFGVADRVKYLQGSIFDVTLPDAGFDVVIMSHFVHHFDQATNVALLKRLAGSMKPGGLLIINDFFRAEGLYTPWKNPQPFQFSLAMLVSTEKGRTYTLGECQEMFVAAGLAFKTSKGNFPLPNSYIVGTLAA